MINSIATLYAQGLALSEIGDVLDVSRSKVAGAIHRARKAGDVRFGPRPPRPRKPEAKRACQKARPSVALPALVVGPEPVVEPPTERSCWSTWRRKDASIRPARPPMAATFSVAGRGLPGGRNSARRGPCRPASRLRACPCR